MCGQRAAHNLLQNGNSRRNKCSAIDQELQRGQRELDIKVDLHVSDTWGWGSRCTGTGKWMKVGFQQRGGNSAGRGRVHCGCAPIPQNSGVYAADEALSSRVWFCSNPIIRDGLIRG